MLFIGFGFATGVESYFLFPLMAVLSVLPSVGVMPWMLRDWTVCVRETDVTDAADAVDAPLNLTGRFALASDQTAEHQSLSESLDHALLFGTTLLAASLTHQRGASGGPVIVKTQRLDSGVRRTLGGLSPWSPGYWLMPHQLSVSTAGQGLADQTLRDPVATPQGRLAGNAQRYFGSASQLAWLDAVQLRNVIGRHREWIAKQVASDSEGRERARKHLAKIEDVVRIFDAAFLTLGFHEDHVRIVLGASLDRNE